nr:serine/threonine-protein kinase PrkC [uncultured bacterium]
MVDQFGHFKILDRIGGRAVEVYRARDTRAGRTVALKVLPADLDPADREKLFERARAVSRLSHPNIAALYEIGDDGGPFLVFEFVPGQSLATLVAGGPFNPKRAVDLATQMADALSEAHAAGIAHGAITTDAVIVTPKGPAKILDFGLAAWTNGHRPLPSASAAERADIEALGAILFEMLTGHAAASGPLTPSAANRSVPRELDPIVMKAFGRGAANRYDSAVMMVADLRTVAVALEQRSATAPPPPVIAGRPNRSPAVWVAIVLLLCALAAVAAWWWL